MLYRIAAKIDGLWEWASYLDTDERRVKSAYATLQQYSPQEPARIVTGKEEWALDNYLLILNQNTTRQKKREDLERLVLEQGEGGDHDKEYQFALPQFLNYAAWGKLIAKVQQGNFTSDLKTRDVCHASL